jgi:hypothetical protein
VDGVGGHVPVEVQHRLDHLGQGLEFGPAQLVGLDDQAVFAAVVVVGVERPAGQRRGQVLVSHRPAGRGRASSPSTARVAAAIRGRSGSRTMIVGLKLVGSGTTADSLFERTFDPTVTVPQRHRSTRRAVAPTFGAGLAGLAGQQPQDLQRVASLSTSSGGGTANAWASR